ncbi:MAG: polysaccharide deacetylase family protein, partial [Acidimicrobiales bacterium]
MGLAVTKATKGSTTIPWGLMFRPMLALLTALAIAAPFGVYTIVSQFENTVLDQQGLTPSTLTAAEVDRYRELAAAGGSDVPLLLSYHDVRPPDAEDLVEQDELLRLEELGDDTGAEDIYTVTPDLFADQMAMLRSAGYTTITTAEFVAWLDGEPLSDKSVLLTFDDGTSGLWRYVDPILEEHGMVATAFIITGRVGTARPYYLSWEELDLMAESGRWDIESHTHLGHDRIDISAQGEP